MENYSLSDVAAVTRSDNGFFGGEGGGFFWIFALLLLPMLTGNGGLWGNCRGGNPVTEADLCQSQSFTELKNSVAQNGAAISQMYTGLQNGLCNLGYETLSNFNALERQLASCCCDIQRGIDSINYNSAMNTAAINANTTAQTQKILDAICGNRMADMQNQINQLMLSTQLCGVVRYPTATTYGAGMNPFFNSSCGYCCNNNI